jgi:tetratricopeptide (TPR) repeat protein
LIHALGVACDKSYYRPEAIEYLNHCIELITPSSEYFSAIYQDLASAYSNNFNQKEALGAYLRALEYTPGDTFLVFKIASHYDNMMGDKDMALKYYRQFLSMRPQKIPANQRKGVGIDVSYFDFVERKIAALKEEKFWNGEASDSTKKEVKEN